MDNLQLVFDYEKHRNKKGMPRQRPQVATMSTADLTQTIMKYIKAKGGYVVRINCFGMYDEKKQQWRKSTTERGTADIHACIRGQHVSIEIKNAGDEMSQHQHTVKQAVEAAGGIYLVVREFVDFHVWYRGLQ